ncbi:hypothetical protein EDD22DRAFT_934507, partial [Suillus occidentalis]
MNLRQRQRWSLITVLYLVVRTSCYAIAWFAVHPADMPLVSLTDAVSNILYYTTNVITVVTTAMLGGELQKSQ